MLNIFRALIFIIVSTFLPGSSIFNLVFPKKLHEKFKVESFILKITLYPIISLIFIGLIVLIAEKIGVIDFFVFQVVLVSSILSLVGFDFLKQIIQKKKMVFQESEFNCSKWSFLIMLASVGVILISLIIPLGLYYLVPGDSWAGVGSASYIGRPERNIYHYGERISYYPLFWGHILFGLSILCGIPYVNVNVLLAPFCYLFVTSIYLLMKAFLSEYKERYAVLATLLLTTFSGLFFLNQNFGPGNVSGLIFVGVFTFIYKSFAQLLMILGLAFYVLLDKSLINSIFKNLRKRRFEQIQLISIVAFFFFQSFLVYIFPCILGILIVLIYSISIKKIDYFTNLRNICVLFLFIGFFFIIFDYLFNYYLSFSFFKWIGYFFPFEIIGIIEEEESYNALIYSCLFLVLTGCVVVIIISFLIDKKIKKKREIKFMDDKLDDKIANSISKINKSKKYFIISLSIFSMFLVIDLIVILIENFVLNSDLNEKYIFYLTLDYFFLNIGFLGIFSFYFSFLFYKKDKKLFFFVFIWISIFFILAYSIFLLNWKGLFIGNPKSFYGDYYNTMLHWFNRIWYYSLIPISINASVVLNNISKKIKGLNFFNRNFHRKEFLKYAAFLIFIFLTFSGILISGMWNGNKHNRLKDREAEVIGWASENIPDNTEILIEDSYNLKTGLYMMTDLRLNYIDEYFEEEDSESNYLKVINLLKGNSNKYLIISKDFIQDSNNLSIFIRNYLIPNFYSELKFESDDNKLFVYYAPYFD